MITIAVEKIVNAVGRPRTTSYEPEQMIKLGKEMIQWVLENDPLHLSQWYTIHEGFTYNEWKSFIMVPEFLPYYEQALKLVGLKYLDKTSNIREGISQRWQRVYFKDLKDQEDEDQDEKDERAKKLIDYEYDKKAACDFRNQQTQETLDTAKEIQIAKLAYENEQMRKQLEELKNAQPKTDSIVQ